MPAAPPPAPPAAVSTLEGQLAPSLAAARRLAAGAGEALWPGYGRAPFGFLLVGGEKDVLLCAGSAPPGFSAAAPEPVTGCDRSERPPAGLPTNLLASMNAVGPEAETIVMGSPQATGRSLPDWTRTVLHEHFHQYEATFPDYHARIAALGLESRPGDGMWMIAYPFPYADPAVAAAHAAAARALAEAVEARGTPGFLPAFDRYLAARAAFQAAVPAKDWRYFEFQLWKEGVARWTEVELGRRFPDKAVADGAEALWTRSLQRLRAPDLAQDGRDAVYPFGAAEAALMEACGPAWRTAYPRALALGDLLRAARAACRA